MFKKQKPWSSKNCFKSSKNESSTKQRQILGLGGLCFHNTSLSLKTLELPYTDFYINPYAVTQCLRHLIHTVVTKIYDKHIRLIPTSKYTVKYSQRAPTCVTVPPPPNFLTSETWGPSACAKWGSYHSPLPCIRPPGWFYCSSTEEKGTLWRYFTIIIVIHFKPVLGVCKDIHIKLHIYTGYYYGTIYICIFTGITITIDVLTFSTLAV